MQTLCQKVWNNFRLHEAFNKVELDWLRRELGIENATLTSLSDAEKLIRAAAILSSSEERVHREAAYRIATYVFELYGSDQLPFEQALRVILTRLGNFPSLLTSPEVESSYNLLPVSLLCEEISTADRNKIRIGEKDVYLTNFQYHLWDALIHNKKTAISAPTSAGKSFVLQHYLSTLFYEDKNATVIYIVPTRALIAQVAEDLSSHLKSYALSNPEIITVPIDSESEITNKSIFVMTQERLQLQINYHPELSPDLVVVDEAQSISDYDRGVLLQWVVDDLLNSNQKAQILFASPTVENLNIFSNIFGIEELSEYKSTEPTVAQNFILIKIKSATKGIIQIFTASDGKSELKEVATLQLNNTLASGIEKLVHISACLSQGQSCIVYANGQATAENIAIQLTDLLPESEPTKEQIALAQLISESVHPHYVLCETVKRGVGFHYSNIPTQVRQAVEKATSAGHIKYLASTSTLLQGVNLPTKNIFMCAPNRGRGKPLDSIDFWNLSGRAGRLCKEFQGNIFLIDYDNWDKKPLAGPKEVPIVPAIEKSLREQAQPLLDIITNNETEKKPGQSKLESAFVKLFIDYRNDELKNTFSRLGIIQDSEEYKIFSEALTKAASIISLPQDVIRQTPGISAHKQQKLYNSLSEIIVRGEKDAEKLIPLHPREQGAFDSYANILKLCHDIILNIDTTRNLHRFHALMSIKWMKGIPLPQIIDEQITRAKSDTSKKSKKFDKRAIIRETLELIETKIRFEAVRLFGCYNTLLTYALNTAGLNELISRLPSIPLYLELGASDKTMISFISMGMSRVSAMKLNETSIRKNMDPNEALNWLKSKNLDSLGLSPLLIEEINLIINR